MTVDWSNTVIYRLCSNNPLIEDGYVGKSGDFGKRKSKHKSDCNNVKSEAYNYPVYTCIRENGGFDDWYFEILETANLEDEKEAAILERYWIEKLETTLNIQLPARTPEEKVVYYREFYRIRHRQMKDDPEYRKKNAEHLKKRREDPELKKKDAAKQKEKITCICGAIHTRNGKSQHLDSKKHKKFLENNPQET